MRFGLRMIRKSPGFAVAAILTLALGIGGTTAIFSFVEAVLLKPLPFPEAERIDTTGAERGVGGGRGGGVLYTGVPSCEGRSISGLAA